MTALRGWCFWVLIISLLAACQSEGGSSKLSAFDISELEWREERSAAMKDSTSWLAIAGLFWLEDGRNSFGTGEFNDIILPEGSASKSAGFFILKDGKVTVEPEEGVCLTVRGNGIDRFELASDSEGNPDILELNDLRMWIIERGNRLAVRLRDFNAASYREYQGLDFYPPDQEFKLSGNLVPFDSVRTVSVPTVVGTETVIKSPGYVEFELKGEELRLDLFADSIGAEKFFIIFGDETSGSETYGACRYMSAVSMGNGRVELNFNRAVNPPCAYTPYATCPLPPPRNILPLRIEAGEKNYRKSHGGK